MKYPKLIPAFLIPVLLALTGPLFAADGIHLLPPAYEKLVGLLHPALVSLGVK